jgi:hypothetical protein
MRRLVTLALNAGLPGCEPEPDGPEVLVQGREPVAELGWRPW